MIKTSNSNLKQNQNGAVALITVILLMFIFLIVTLGFLRTVINEQKNTTDTDLQTRAYYAAESGIEDAKRILNSFYADGSLSDEELANLKGNTCDSATLDGNTADPLSSELDTKVTCQLIDLEADDFVASVGVNKSVFVPLKAASGARPTRVVIEWHENGVDSAGVVARDAAETDIPDVNCWNTGENGSCSGTPYPAMMRAGVFGHTTGAVTRQSIINNNRIAYLNPVNVPSADGEVALNAEFEPKTNTATSLGNQPSNILSNDASCANNTPGGYMCSLEITTLTPNLRQSYLRLTPIYKGANIRITMFYGSLQLKFDHQQAKIDVTAQAGDVIRRIETRIPLRSIDILPDEAITTADQLCKLVTIVDGNTATDNCLNP